MLGLFLALASALYGNTIGHEYAVDDRIVVFENEFTTQGLRGIPSILRHDTFVGFFGENTELVQGGRYRPLSLVTFAIEYELFGANPHVSHLINVLLYGLTGFLVFMVLRRFCGIERAPAWWLHVPLLASVLFMIHPLHTEVVANIKGRDEILALLCGLTSLLLQLRYLRTQRAADLVASGVVFLLALLAKESAFPLIAIFPLTFFVFTDVSVRRGAPAVGATLVAAAGALLLRHQATAGSSPAAVAEILNDPFVFASFAERTATVFVTLGRYLALLLFPHPLTHDYYFNHVPLVDWTHPGAIGSLVIHLGLLAFMVARVPRRSPLAYGVSFYLLALFVVSNLVISVGVLMSERFLYIPSLGFALVVAYGVEALARRTAARRAVRIALAAASITVLVGFSARTVVRNQAWHDDLTLFRTDVQTSSHSAKAHASLGGTLIQGAKERGPGPQRDRDLAEGIPHLERAVEIYPRFGLAWSLLGSGYAQTGDRDRAMRCYATAIETRPDLPLSYAELGALAIEAGDYERSIRAYRRLLRIDPRSSDAWYGLGLAYESLDQADSAAVSFERVLGLQPDHSDALGKLGTVHGSLRGDLDRSIHYLQRAIQAGSTRDWVYHNLGVALVTQKRYQEAIQVFQAGLDHHPESADLYLGLAATYQMLGDEARARAMLNKAQALQRDGSR